MNFVDHTGHIFEINDYTSYPIGFEYETTPYVFWFNGEYQNNLSVKNYYVLPIRFIAENITSIEITIDSSIYSFYKNLNIDNATGNNDILELDEINFVKTLSIDDINEIKINETQSLFTFYIFAIAENEGTWLTNVLINIDNETYCPITIGGTFIDEIEELKINARNMGVRLPKDILKALYRESYLNDEFDAVTYNTKLKEYLINYMVLRGECGNYNSALAALKWFGWNDKLQVSKLLKTDNELKELYIRDYFNVYNDIPESYKNFKQTTYLSLYVKYNQETDEIYNETLNASTGFYGEGKPILENLFDKTVEKHYDGSDISFIRGYYECSLNEMMFKLSCLAYMYKKYFLPIHLSIKTSAVQEFVFANDIKFLTTTYSHICETPLLTSDQSNNIQTKVSFDENTTYFLHNKFTADSEKYYIDTNYIYIPEYTPEFCESSEDTFYQITNAIHTEVPIYFTSKNDDVVYDCVLIFSKSVYDETNKTYTTNVLKESHFTFAKTKDTHEIKFVITPKCFNNTFDIKFWEKEMFTIDILCNGTWYKHTFKIDIPEFDISFAKLKYQYNYELQRQLKDISDDSLEFNTHIFEPGLVQINNVSFYESLINAITIDNMYFDFNIDFNDDFKIQTMLKYFIKTLSETVKINNNTSYLNKIKVFDIYTDKGKKLRYNGNYLNTNTDTFITQQVIDVYNDFFEKTDSSISYKLESVFQPKRNLKTVTPEIINTYLHDNYDFYLMHDGKYYFGVLLSKYTLDSLSNNNTYPNEQLERELETLICQGDKKYTLRLYKESDIFLVNRMTIEYPTDEYGNIIGHFSKDDIIVSKVKNIDIPYILTNGGSKWEYENMSINKNGFTIEPVYSKTNAGIMSIDESHRKYASGYYNVTVNFAVDDFTSHNRTIKSRILIKK